MAGDMSIAGKLDLKVGDWVMVRSAEEILATLDANARFEEMPFMPQMLQRCGRKFQVRKRAHKVCDTAFGTGGRQLTDAVFLDDTRCDGVNYGGCELRCTIIWKEAWLRRADASEPDRPSAASGQLESLVLAGTKKVSPGQPSSDPLYVCQATQLPAATKLLPWWKPNQYLEDYRSGNVALSDIISRLAFLVYAELVASGLGFGSALRWIYNKVQAIRGGQPYPVRPGHLPIGGPTPSINLGLEEGEYVRVKSGEEILATVDELLVNKGMGFSPEMMSYCGKTFRISQRLRRLIDEKTGQLKELKTPCLVLEGADCEGTCTRPLSCPRACPPYWREIWLERVNTNAVENLNKAASAPGR
ncbi:MAG TPA: hypothetical protein VHN11_14810 [Xanthobacteraceae bacterium]|jgi:hypothetical protein|nr:hypothetical protein [Xanthobacteraceae bacterium]